MVRFYSILLLSYTSFLLVGCPGPASEKPPIWKQVKIGDLAPHTTPEPNQQLSDTINIDVYIFEISAQDVNALDNIWPLLYIQPLQFNSYNAFAINLFAAGFSDAQTWNGISDILRNASAKRVERDSLILVNNKPKELPVIAIDTEQTFFYTSIAAQSEGVTIGPGALSLQLKAQKIPGLRGVCDMNIQPIFSPLSKSRIERLKEDEGVPFVFDALGFGLKLSPGDIFLLGPKKYTTDKGGLSAVFFSRQKPRPVVRLYVFVCGQIAD